MGEAAARSDRRSRLHLRKRCLELRAQVGQFGAHLGIVGDVVSAVSCVAERLNYARDIVNLEEVRDRAERHGRIW